MQARFLEKKIILKKHSQCVLWVSVMKLGFEANRAQREFWEKSEQNDRRFLK